MRFVDYQVLYKTVLALQDAPWSAEVLLLDPLYNHFIPFIRLAFAVLVFQFL